MVVNRPVERPHTLDGLVNRLNKQQRQVDEQGRQSTYPLSISHAGVPDFTVLPNASGTGSLVKIYDGAGHLLYSTDPDTEYGLATPGTPIPVYPALPGVTTVSATSFTQFLTGQFTVVNSSFAIQWSVRTAFGSAPSAISESYALVSDFPLTYSQQSPTYTSSTVGSGSVTEYSPVWAFTFPPEHIGRQFFVDLFVRIAQGGGSPTVAAAPIQCGGCSRATAVSFGA